jgi:DNA repair exonuclease SbcCD nuclease subunit
MKGRSPVRVLHTSDIHIGLHEKQEPPEDHKPLRALKAVIDYAIDSEVDLLLIAGDFFDNNRVKEPLITAGGEQLKRLKVPTVILPGNHDNLVENSIYRKSNFRQHIEMVQVITNPNGERFHFDALDISVWGRPHANHDDFSPLATPPARGPEKWNFGIAHGHYVHSPADWGRAYPILPKEISESNLDYIALGHWDVFHAIAIGPVQAYYSGSPLTSQSCALINVRDDALSVEKIELKLPPD